VGEENGGDSGAEKESFEPKGEKRRMGQKLTIGKHQRKEVQVICGIITLRGEEDVGREKRLISCLSGGGPFRLNRTGNKKGWGNGRFNWGEQGGRKKEQREGAE